MGRKMFAYLSHMYCLAEGWSKPGSVLSQIRVSWNMGYLEGMEEWNGWLPFYLSSIIYNSLEWRVGFSLFFKKITPLSLADITWILWSFDQEALVEWMEVLGLWLWGSMAGRSGCQYPEWVTDRPDIFRLEIVDLFGMKTCRWQVPFPKWMHHSTKLKVTSDSSNGLCNIRL